LKLGIPYENKGFVALWVKGAVIAAIDGIIPLPEVEAVKTMVLQTGDSWLGGRTPPVVIVIEGV
jgi:hypothetical protein